MLELYGSTEAAISTFRRRTDPRGSVGEISDPFVKILNESGRECPPARLDPDGKILNYAEAVGEICRVAPDTALFQGYFANPEANTAKVRGDVYHSGDLGHILERGGQRFLYFDGRTDDWIRKDGENFSAAQVARLLQEHDDVTLAAAYGAPCQVSDELVMAALKLRPGVRFDPQDFFDFCERQVTSGGMDRKWFPDFVRVVEEFEYTQTQKVLVRNLKQTHFDLRRLPDAEVYWRRRGDARFRPFTREDWEGLRREFAACERSELLDRQLALEITDYRIALHAPAGRVQVGHRAAPRHGRTRTWTPHLHFVILGTSLALETLGRRASGGRILRWGSLVWTRNSPLTSTSAGAKRTSRRDVTPPRSSTFAPPTGSTRTARGSDPSTGCASAWPRAGSIGRSSCVGLRPRRSSSTRSSTTTWRACIWRSASRPRRSGICAAG
jgi:hypothetical protein